MNNEPVQTQAAEEDSEAETQTDTDAESAVSGGSSSVNALAWQDDPEFQAKVRLVENIFNRYRLILLLYFSLQSFSLVFGTPLLSKTYGKSPYVIVLHMCLREVMKPFLPNNVTSEGNDCS